MKKYIIKSLFFIIPLILMQLFFLQCHTTKKGDLLRLGFLPDIYPSYRDTFQEFFAAERKFIKISDEKKQRLFDVFTIGDSFSEQNAYGYQNYLASDYGISVLHYDRHLHWNPVNTLYGLVNSNFFEHYQVKYVILQTVERYTSDYAEHADSAFIFSTEQVVNLVQEQKNNSPKEQKIFINLKKYFPSAETVTLTMNLIRLSVLGNQIFNKMVYKVMLSDSPFSNRARHLLFFIEDIQAIEKNNKIENIEKLNEHLNNIQQKLKQKNITLIYLPSPDKFDFYFEYITDSTYNKPYFFDLFRKTEKEYLFIDTRKKLKELSKETKDIYFYDDTHWSPYATKHLAIVIDSIMNQTNKKEQHR